MIDLKAAKFRTLGDPIYLGSHKIDEIWKGNVMVYPEQGDIFVGGASSIVFNNKVYLFNVDTKADRKIRENYIEDPAEGMFKKCISYDGNKFTYEFMTPNVDDKCGMLWALKPFIYNGNLYLANGGDVGIPSSTKFYRYSNGRWIEIQIPRPKDIILDDSIRRKYQFSGFSPVVHNGYVYILGAGININYSPYGMCSYKWDGSSWSFVEVSGTTRTNWSGLRCTISYKGCMYHFGNNAVPSWTVNFVKYNDESNAELINFPTIGSYRLQYIAMNSFPPPVIYNNKLYIFLVKVRNYNIESYHLCEWDGNAWTNIYDYYDNKVNPSHSSMVVYNGKIYVFGGGGNYSSRKTPVQPQTSKMLHTWDPINGWVRLPDMKFG